MYFPDIISWNICFPDIVECRSGSLVDPECFGLWFICLEKNTSIKGQKHLLKCYFHERFLLIPCMLILLGIAFIM